MQSSLPKALANDLRRVVGDDWVLTEPDRLLAYESDGLTAYRMLPGAVVLPKDTDEVTRGWNLSGGFSSRAQFGKNRR